MVIDTRPGVSPVMGSLPSTDRRPSGVPPFTDSRETSDNTGVVGSSLLGRDFSPRPLVYRDVLLVVTGNLTLYFQGSLHSFPSLKGPFLRRFRFTVVSLSAPFMVFSLCIFSPILYSVVTHFFTPETGLRCPPR